mmetsp:Transcript_4375/g.5877  ORF Transcript_4375/g.5877 Transcript_4375/m.5877 type:complete len:221 (-) Transcript_4375:241-903(-)
MDASDTPQFITLPKALPRRSILCMCCGWAACKRVRGRWPAESRKHARCARERHRCISAARIPSASGVEGGREANPGIAGWVVGMETQYTWSSNGEVLECKESTEETASAKRKAATTTTSVSGPECCSMKSSKAAANNISCSFCALPSTVMKEATAEPEELKNVTNLMGLFSYSPNDDEMSVEGTSSQFKNHSRLSLKFGGLTPSTARQPLAQISQNPKAT